MSTGGRRYLGISQDIPLFLNFLLSKRPYEVSICKLEQFMWLSEWEESHGFQKEVRGISHRQQSIKEELLTASEMLMKGGGIRILRSLSGR